MKLEIVSRRPAAPSVLPPLVLVHGAWQGAWCWEDTFLRYFADTGWEAHALSLRGHGRSEGREGLRWWSIADYVADLDQVVRTLDRSPVIVGHSMGGFVTQKYLEDHRPAGAVLMASVPPSGMVRFYVRLLRRHPIAWLKATLLLTPQAVLETPELVREWLFSPELPAEALTEYHSRLQEESFRATVDMLFLDLPRPSRIQTPIAVLGAGRDAIFSVAEVEATARAYGVEAHIFPGMAHEMTREAGWQAVAECILAWAAEKAVAPAEGRAGSGSSPAARR